MSSGKVMGGAALTHPTGLNLMDKSFLVLFFKKERAYLLFYRA
jgi:hypothetical protein